jgi:death on curing protein
MKAPTWVLRETVLALHEQLLAEFGGSAGIRDEGMLDFTLGRPENLFHYSKPTIFDLAASYGFGLLKNHPFVDGNKRMAFTVAILFLEINGYRLQASEADAVIRTLALAAGETKEAEYAAWLKENSRKK